MTRYLCSIYDMYMITKSAGDARQHWAETMDQAQRGPVSITSHGRGRVVLMSVDLAERSLEALEDAEDIAEAEWVRGRYRTHPEEFISHEDMMREFG